jgi:hypothetical protein
VNAPRCITTGKRCFKSRRQAHEANRTNGARLRVYACKHCGLLHVTRDGQHADYVEGWR